MANFDIAVKITIEKEGDLVNDPNDSGGETYKGISRKNFPIWEGWKIIDTIKNKSTETLNRIPDLQLMVLSFYKNEFWDKVCGDEINSQEIANTIFDFAVNAGIKTSVKLAQITANVVSDGIMGVNTVKALNSISESGFIAVFAIQKIIRYIEICEKHPKNREYFYGWIKRAVDYE